MTLAGHAAAEPATAPLSFDTHEIALGAASDATVLVGFFLGNRHAEVATAYVDERGRRRLTMHAFNGSDWKAEPEATLRDDVLFVDVAHIGGRDCLITYSPGRLRHFDPVTQREAPLLDAETTFESRQNVIPRIDISRDLNRDGRDDIVLPDVDGFWIAIQQANGRFAEAVKFGPPEPFREQPVGNIDFDEPGLDPAATYGDVGITAVTAPWYLSRVHTADVNRDGRADLLFWNEDRFDVHFQDERGQFDPAAEPVTVAVHLDSDGAYSRVFEFSDDGVSAILFGVGEKSTRTMLRSILDMNGDGIEDLLTLIQTGRSIAKQKSIYRVHYGSDSPTGLQFSSDPGATIRPRGKAGGMQAWGYAVQWFDDFDDDGQVDALFKDVAVGIGGLSRTLVGKSVPVNIELFRMDAGQYPSRPTDQRRVRRFAPFAGMENIFFPTVLLGDVNGDRRADLVIGQSPKELRIYPGGKTADLFARSAEKVTIAVPPDERKTWLEDVNADGRMDIVMHHTATTHDPEIPHRVTLLISR